ncbi:WhiB family transcriptional regulator [Streptomyces genisteinicus]|uniref:WhiB family transcriptional regulator n=1 Tax=Streptomyces genisteinicus TaxID=2768068 RepID=A0A7H0I595_9ACTN|nr:WhiB family transcriptional regulator [Streptomyces genisteinicus]QNP67961.1 WhiB family transcriptional regulator [Streptomyces genisteinicus]
MTPTDARAMRRGVLQQLVDEGALCAAGDPGRFFRLDGESVVEWQPRRDSAVRLCAECPARTACEELALRDGEGRAGTDDMVRAGHTGPALVALRRRHSERLAAAVAVDRDTEGARLDALVAQLLRTAIKNPDKAGGGYRGGPAQTAQNAEICALAVQVQAIRTARRTRAGWEAAA